MTAPASPSAVSAEEPSTEGVSASSIGHRARALAALFPRIEACAQGLNRRFTPCGQWLAGAGCLAALFGLDVRRSFCWQFAGLVLAWLLAALLSARLRRVPVRLHCPTRIELRAGRPATLPTNLCSLGQRPLHGLSLEVAAATHVLPVTEFAGLYRQLAGIPARWVATELAWVSFRESLYRHRGHRPERHALTPLMPGEQRSLALPFTALRRGLIRVPGLYLLAEDPLGLVRKVRRIDCPLEILALPQSLPSAHWRQEQSTGSGRESRRSARSPGEEEFRALRAYRPGDSRRHIHWRMSARRGALMVRERSGGVPERAQVTLLAIATEPTGVTFEAAVRVAAACLEQRPGGETSACLVLTGPGGLVELAARSSADHRAQLHALALCSALPVRAAGRLIEAMATRLPTDVPVEWVLPLPLPEHLLARIGQIARTQPRLRLLLVGDERQPTLDLPQSRWLRPAALEADWIQGSPHG